MKKRGLALLLTAGLLATGLSGCAGQSEGGAGETEKVRLMEGLECGRNTLGI